MNKNVSSKAYWHFGSKRKTALLQNSTQKVVVSISHRVVYIKPESSIKQHQIDLYMHTSLTYHPTDCHFIKALQIKLKPTAEYKPNFFGSGTGKPNNSPTHRLMALNLTQHQDFSVSKTFTNKKNSLAALDSSTLLSLSTFHPTNTIKRFSLDRRFVNTLNLRIDS